MKGFQKKTPWEREWELLLKKEASFLKRQEEKSDSPLNRLLYERIPQALQERLDITFSKAFSMVFHKGKGLIEKSCRKEEIEKNYKINVYTALVREDRKALRKFSERAGAAGRKNLLLSGAEGVGLGLLGIGLPDIPLFMGMIFKSLYEMALHYGFSWDSEEEKYFLLLVIRGALLRGEDLRAADRLAEEYIAMEKLPEDYNRDREIRRTSETLSGELLYMKFLQGVPLVGAVGGAYDAVYLNRILAYGKLKYRKRFLLKYKSGAMEEEWRKRNV